MTNTYIDMKMILLKIFFAIIALYFLYALFFFIIQRTLIYPVHAIPETVPISDNSIEKSFINIGKNKSEVWFLPPVNPESDKFPVLIIAHGNASLIDFWPGLLQIPRKMGLAALLVEYPGYGRSDGNVSQENITEAFKRAYENLLKRPDIDTSKIIFLGRSLGGGVVCSLAEHYQPAAMILLSTFTSVKSFAGRFLLPSFLVKDPYNNADLLHKYKGPLLLAHGRADQVIPFKHAQKLRRIRPDAFWIEYPTDHNFTPPDWNEFWQQVALFLNQNHIIEFSGERHK